MKSADRRGLQCFDFFVISFFMDATVSCAGLLANYYAQDVGATKFQIGLKDFAWGVTYMMSCLVTGRLADRFPRRTLLMTGIALQGFSAWSLHWCQTPVALIAVMPLNALGCSLFWPIFMTFLHDPDEAESNRRIGWFNLGWTFGLSVGMAVSGALASWDAHRGFQLIGAAAALNLLYFCLRTAGSAHTPSNHPTTQPPNRVTTTRHAPRTTHRRSYLYLAWLCNFTLFFASSAVGNQFPVLARSLNVPDTLSSVLIALNIVGLGAGSLLMARVTVWHDRFAPMLGAKMLALGALALLLVAVSPLAFGAGLLALGCARAVGYTTSLYYGLNSDLPKGFAMGVHETLIGAAFTAGPFVAGGLAQLFTLRAPFTFALCSVAVAAVIASAMWWRSKRGTTMSV